MGLPEGKEAPQGDDLPVWTFSPSHILPGVPVPSDDCPPPLHPIHSPDLPRVFLAVQMVKTGPAMQENWVQCLGQEDLEKGMAAHSSIFARIIPRTEEPGRLESM